jgi:hypothetical protein
MILYVCTYNRYTPSTHNPDSVHLSPQVILKGNDFVEKIKDHDFVFKAVAYDVWNGCNDWVLNYLVLMKYLFYRRVSCLALRKILLTR